MENMHNAELYGRVIRCNYAKPQAIKGGEHGWSAQPVWADADKYQEDMTAGEEVEEEEEGDDPMAALEASVD
jgi:peptidyl-prolyl isomerase E (cyclophilin E)